MTPPEFPAGVILLLTGGLIIALPFVSRPMTAAVEARWSVAIKTVSAGIIFTYAAAFAAALLTT